MPLKPIKKQTFAVLVVIALGPICLGIATALGEEPKRSCETKTGTLPGPFVAKEETARQIFQTIARNYQSAAKMQSYDIDVSDEGDSWTVSQSPKECRSSDRDARDGVLLTACFGGGGIAMNIRKCDGAISSVYFQK